MGAGTETSCKEVVISPRRINYVLQLVWTVDFYSSFFRMRRSLCSLVCLCVFFRRRCRWDRSWVWTGTKRWPQLGRTTAFLFPPATLSTSSTRPGPREPRRYRRCDQQQGRGGEWETDVLFMGFTESCKRTFSHGWVIGCTTPPRQFCTEAPVWLICSLTVQNNPSPIQTPSRRHK